VITPTGTVRSPLYPLPHLLVNSSLPKGTRVTTWEIFTSEISQCFLAICHSEHQSDSCRPHPDPSSCGRWRGRWSYLQLCGCSLARTLSPYVILQWDTCEWDGNLRCIQWIPGWFLSGFMTLSLIIFLCADSSSRVSDCAIDSFRVFHLRDSYTSGVCRAQQWHLLGGLHFLSSECGHKKNKPMNIDKFSLSLSL